jgi:hypothetical protein
MVVVSAPAPARLEPPLIQRPAAPLLASLAAAVQSPEGGGAPAPEVLTLLVNQPAMVVPLPREPVLEVPEVFLLWVWFAQ